MTTTSAIFKQENEDYIDIFVCIDTEIQGAWKFVVSLDKELGNVYDSDPQWAAHGEWFDETDKHVPDYVAQAFAAIRPKMVVMLEQSKCTS